VVPVPAVVGEAVLSVPTPAVSPPADAVPAAPAPAPTTTTTTTPTPTTTAEAAAAAAGGAAAATPAGEKGEEITFRLVFDKKTNQVTFGKYVVFTESCCARC
jgi:hypothetical protein